MFDLFAEEFIIYDVATTPKEFWYFAKAPQFLNRQGTI
jgi:hypothetical protein